MFVAALILLIIAVLLVVAALFGGNDPATMDLGSFNLEANVTVMFFLGMVTLLLFVLSLGMFRIAAKRAAARRADKKKVSELSTKLDEYKREQRASDEPASRDEA
jgi:hypothetical protein